MLELGSGCGVAGLVAVAMGAAHVSLTDLPAVLPVLARNAQRSCGAGSGNSGSSSGCGDGGGSGSASSDGSGDSGGTDAKWEVWALEWDDEDRVAQAARAGPLDVILGADVTTFVQLLPALARTVHALASPTTDIYIAEGGRGDSNFLEEEFEAHGFSVRRLALPPDLAAGRCGVYHLRKREGHRGGGSGAGEGEGGDEGEYGGEEEEETVFEERLQELARRGELSSMKALLREREARLAVLD